jgi:hypothetical protein
VFIKKAENQLPRQLNHSECPRGIQLFDSELLSQIDTLSLAVQKRTENIHIVLKRLTKTNLSLIRLLDKHSKGGSVQTKQLISRISKLADDWLFARKDRSFLVSFQGGLNYHLTNSSNIYSPPKNLIHLLQVQKEEQAMKNTADRDLGSTFKVIEKAINFLRKKPDRQKSSQSNSNLSEIIKILNIHNNSYGIQRKSDQFLILKHIIKKKWKTV